MATKEAAEAGANWTNPLDGCCRSQNSAAAAAVVVVVAAAEPPID